MICGNICCLGPGSEQLGWMGCFRGIRISSRLPRDNQGLAVARFALEAPDRGRLRGRAGGVAERKCLLRSSKLGSCPTDPISERGRTVVVCFWFFWCFCLFVV